MKHIVQLQSGTLHMHIEQAEVSLENLCGFSSRRSHRRGFVFVSKVLGKHFPVRPSAMQVVYRQLASKLDGLPGPVVFIGMAETATGLGQGIYEEFVQRTGRTDALFLHSTRYHLARPLAFTFEETHSHATKHRLYLPVDSDNIDLFRYAASLVLVDDEMSTGRTLINLARQFANTHSKLREIHFVTITDWMSSGNQHELTNKVGVSTQCHSLLRGSFMFSENPDFAPGEIPSVDGNNELKDRYLQRNYGRLGCRGRLEIDGAILQLLPVIEAGRKVLVLGTGEFSYLPFKLALCLEQQGHDVVYQSTTRSPLLIDGALTSVLEFRDHCHDDIPNFVYNVVDRKYDNIIVCYETSELPPNHHLPNLLKAHSVFF